eukprot:GFYU01040445.1.p1 GENE.GFYU01040445.1~~GFYU01040445.1.p1  ORF type:complete len:128 (-),score=10.34 GFYU01040445.1:83-466(-)
MRRCGGVVSSNNTAVHLLATTRLMTMSSSTRVLLAPSSSRRVTDAVDPPSSSDKHEGAPGVQTRHGRVGVYSQGSYSVNVQDSYGSAAKRKEEEERSIGSVHKKALLRAKAAVNKAVSMITSRLGTE